MRHRASIIAGSTLLWRQLKAVLIAALVISTMGCAYAYVDREGRRHVVGLLHVQLPETVPATANDSLRTTTFGLSLVRSLHTTEFSLGFNASSWTYLPMDSCARLEAATTEPSVHPLARSTADVGTEARPTQE